MTDPARRKAALRHARRMIAAARLLYDDQPDLDAMTDADLARLLRDMPPGDPAHHLHLAVAAAHGRRLGMRLDACALIFFDDGRMGFVRRDLLSEWHLSRYVARGIGSRASLAAAAELLALCGSGGAWWHGLDHLAIPKPEPAEVEACKRRLRAMIEAAP